MEVPTWDPTGNAGERVAWKTRGGTPHRPGTAIPLSVLQRTANCALVDGGRTWAQTFEKILPGRTLEAHGGEDGATCHCTCQMHGGRTECVHHRLGDVPVSLANGAETVGPAAPVRRVGCAGGAPQPKSPHVQWKGGDVLLCAIGGLTQQGAQALPDLSVVLNSERGGEGGQAHSEEVGGARRSAEEEKQPSTLQILQSRDAVQEHLLRIHCGLQLFTHVLCSPQRSPQHADASLRRRKIETAEPNFRFWVI